MGYLDPKEAIIDCLAAAGWSSDLPEQACFTQVPR
jgi:hypothetical protein